MANEFVLTAHDKAQGLWLRLSNHLNDRLEECRRRNDGPLTEIETARLRGEIKCLKYIIALGESRPFLTGESEQPLS